jgi:hypothetical protein
MDTQVFGGGSTVCVDSGVVATELTVWDASNAGLFADVLWALFLICSPPPHTHTYTSTVANAKPGIRGDRVTCIPVRDVYMELCVRV